MSSLNRKQTGKLGEQLAVSFLQELKWTLIARNWCCRSGELDIVALDGDVYVFIEVRARKKDSRFGTALESVDIRKQRKVRSLATIFLAQHKLGDVPIRFDVIAVTWSGNQDASDIQHIQGAF